MECHLGGVNLMVGTVVYVGMNAKYREATQNTGFGSLFDTFADSGDIFLRNRTAYYAGLELEGLFT